MATCGTDIVLNLLLQYIVLVMLTSATAIDKCKLHPSTYARVFLSQNKFIVEGSYFCCIGGRWIHASPVPLCAECAYVSYMFTRFTAYTSN